MVGDKLKELRNKKGLTQQEVANRLHISRGTYAHYEINKRKPDIITLKELADFFGVTLDEIVDEVTVSENLILEMHEIMAPKVRKASEELSSLIEEREAEQEFIDWLKENVDGTFFYDFKNTPEARKEMLAQMLSDQKLLWEMERRKKP